MVAHGRRRRQRATAAVIALTAVAGASCVQRFGDGADGAARATGPANAGGPVPVVIVSVDGLRPDAIRKYRARTLQRLMREGSHSLEARTVDPGSTLPSHVSMLTGWAPDAHGVDWNERAMDRYGYVTTTTIFATAREAGLHTAAFFSKSKFEHLAVPGTLDYGRAPHRWPGKWAAERTVAEARRYLQRRRPDLLFVHLAEPDFVGHMFGWMSVPYGWSVREADRQIGHLLRAADQAYGAGNYTVLVTADHGGHGRGHGGEDPRDVLIPWIAWGAGVATGVVLEPGIRTMDTAATVLWLLGVEPEAGGVGRAVTAAFVPSAGTAEVVGEP